MKSIKTLLVVFLIVLALPSFAEKKKKRSKKSTKNMPVLLLKGRAAYKSGKVDRAISILDEAIRKIKSKNQRNLAFYYMGLSLFEKGHYYASYLSFRQIFSNPNKRYKKLYGKAIKNAVTIMDRLGLVERVGRDIQPLSNRNIPQAVVPLAAYARGAYHFSKRRYDEAASEFKQVPPKNEFYQKALMYLGVIATGEKDYKEAAFYFAKVVKLVGGNKRLRNQADLAKLNYARVVYSRGDMEKAVESFARFTSTSPYWQTVLLEASWPLMRLNDTTVSLGNLHTLTSPFFREELVGEAFILRSIILFALCKYEEMRYTLGQFFEIYDPILSAMEAEQGKLSGSLAYYNAYINRKRLNPSFLRYIDRDTGIKNTLTVQNLLKEEKLGLARYSRNQVIQQLRKKIDDLYGYLSVRTGKEIASIHKQKLKEIRQQREQANYLKVEIVTGEKELIEKTKGLPPQRVTDVETNIFEGYQYWPFKGEFWEDELGTYVYTTESSCIN